jgi:hypothetical protein
VFGASHFASQCVSQTSSQFFTKLPGGGSIASCDVSLLAKSFDSLNAMKKMKNVLDQMEAINPLNHYYNVYCLGRLSE